MGDPPMAIWDYCKRAGVSYRTTVSLRDEENPNIKVLEGIMKQSPSSILI